MMETGSCKQLIHGEHRNKATLELPPKYNRVKSSDNGKYNEMGHWKVVVVAAVTRAMTICTQRGRGGIHEKEREGANNNNGDEEWGKKRSSSKTGK